MNATCCRLCGQPTPVPAIDFGAEGVECASCDEMEIDRIEAAAASAADQVTSLDDGMMVRGDDE